MNTGLPIEDNNDDSKKVQKRVSSAPEVLVAPEVVLETESFKERFKAFWSAHWKKILACAGIGIVLVVAGVFTGGLVPLIAGAFGLGMGVAATVGFGGAAAVGSLAGAGVGAIAGAVPSQEKAGVKSFFQRHKWKIIAGIAVALFIVGSVLTGGILAAFGVVAVGGAVGAGLAFCASVITGVAGGVAATTTAVAGVTLSATAATAIGTTVVATEAIAAGWATSCILSAIKDNKNHKDSPPIMPVVEDAKEAPTPLIDRIRRLPVIGRFFGQPKPDLGVESRIPNYRASANNGTL